MVIVIMTRGRVHNQWTVKSIPEVRRADTYFCCPPEEADELEELYNLPAIPFEHPNPNQSNKFQWLLERNMFPAEDKICILDDDLIFSRREELPDRTSLRQIKPEDDIRYLIELFDLIEMNLSDVPQVGVHPRQMGQETEPPYHENGKCITVYGVNRRMIEELGFNKDWRVDYLPIFGDVFLNCHVLSSGGSNRLITQYLVDWKPSQAPGGCSIYRTPELQEQAVDKLVELFGPYVKKVIKKPKASKWLGDERVDFRTQWKKMAAVGRANRGL